MCIRDRPGFVEYMGKLAQVVGKEKLECINCVTDALTPVSYTHLCGQPFTRAAHEKRFSSQTRRDYTMKLTNVAVVAAALALAVGCLLYTSRCV